MLQLWVLVSSVAAAVTLRGCCHCATTNLHGLDNAAGALRTCVAAACGPSHACFWRLSPIACDEQLRFGYIVHGSAPPCCVAALRCGCWLTPCARRLLWLVPGVFLCWRGAGHGVGWCMLGVASNCGLHPGDWVGRHLRHRFNPSHRHGHQYRRSCLLQQHGCTGQGLVSV